MKNLIVYKIMEKVSLKSSELGNYMFTECKEYDFIKKGFVPVLGDDFLAMLGDFDVGVYRTQWKDLPTSAIRKLMDEKIDKEEKIKVRPLSKKEKMVIKEEVVEELLPRCFHKEEEIMFALDNKNQYLFVATSSYKKAEDVIGYLRTAVGSIKVRPLETKELMTNVFTPLVFEGEIDFGEGDSFNFNEFLVLEDNDKGKVTWKDDFIHADLANLEAEGKMVSKVSLNYLEEVSFVLNDDLRLSSINFDKDWLSGMLESEDNETDRAATLMLQLNKLREVILSLIDIHGGEYDYES